MRTSGSLTVILLWWLGSGCLGGCERGDRPLPEVDGGGAAASQARKARFTSVKGSVDIKKPGCLEWVPACVGMEMGLHDKIRTERGSFATLEFETGGLLKIEPESLISVTDLHFEIRTQARRSTFTLTEGRIEAEVDNSATNGSELKITTPSAETSLQRREVSYK